MNATTQNLAILNWTTRPGTEIECCGRRSVEEGHLSPRWCPRCNRETWRRTGQILTTNTGFELFSPTRKVAGFVAAQASKRLNARS